VTVPLIEPMFPSTTYAWRKVKISPAGQAQGTAARRATSSRRRRRRNARQPIWLSVVSRGGPESWWQVDVRGAVIRFPGHLCFDDVMARVNGPLIGER